jgi:GTP-binding protein HflX
MSNDVESLGSAVLVGVQLPGVSDQEHAASLAELGRLVTTLGYVVIATVEQKRDSLAAPSVIGEGKLKELAELTGGKGIIPSYVPERTNKARARRTEQGGAAAPPGDDQDENDDDKPTILVAVDHETTPTQARNLERATGASVLDRSGVIVEIFHRHAKSREARLQVEIARLNYVAPRLRESANSERQAGRGAGESALELDRRKIRDRISELREELEVIHKRDDDRRRGREGQLRVALVGYTNAGKSSLMRALTGSQVLVQDKLFATLDTTIRALQPETKPRLLVSDTVGFIKKLPHDLVASFRSTLDEAHEASLLLYVVDASDPTHENQLEVTRAVLKDIGADVVPSKLVLNKIDRVDAEGRAALGAAHPDAVLLSAKDPEDVARLRQTIIDFFEASMQDEEFIVPYDRQRVVAELHEEARVLSEEYDEAGAHVRVRALPSTLARLRRALDAR